MAWKHKEDSRAYQKKWRKNARATNAQYIEKLRRRTAYILWWRYQLDPEYRASKSSATSKRGMARRAETRAAEKIERVKAIESAKALVRRAEVYARQERFGIIRKAAA